MYLTFLLYVMTGASSCVMTSGIRCSKCGGKTKVTGTKSEDGRVRRYRRCERDDCRQTVVTVERAVGALIAEDSISGVAAAIAIKNLCESLNLDLLPSGVSGDGSQN